MRGVLECSTRGDKRFSAFGAEVEVLGVKAKIEYHYQLAKRFGDIAPKTWKDGKGKKPTHLCIGGIDFPLEYSVGYYSWLWLMYLDNHPELVRYASQYEDFHDMFKSKGAVVCQADVIRKYIKQGRRAVVEDCREFVDRLIKGVLENKGYIRVVTCQHKSVLEEIRNKGIYRCQQVSDYHKSTPKSYDALKNKVEEATGESCENVVFGWSEVLFTKDNVGLVGVGEKYLERMTGMTGLLDKDGVLLDLYIPKEKLLRTNFYNFVDLRCSEEEIDDLTWGDVQPEKVLNISEGNEIQVVMPFIKKEWLKKAWLYDFRVDEERSYNKIPFITKTI